MGYLGRKGEISLFGINLIFLLTALLLITFGYYVQEKNIYLGLLITEFVLILIPPILYVAWKKAGIRNVFRLNKIDTKLLGLCVFITLLAYPVGVFLNLVGHMILSLFGELMPVQIPVADNAGEYVIGLFIIALLPGIAEEFFFRGLVLRGYEGFGPRKAVIIPALLFGLFHFNVQNFIGPFFLGLIFGYMVIRTNSIFPAITGHFINNALSVTMAFLANVFTDQSGLGAEESTNLSLLAAGAVFWGIVALICGLFMVKLLQKLRKVTEDIHEQSEKRYVIGIKEFIPLGVTAVIFILTFVRQMIYIISGV